MLNVPLFNALVRRFGSVDVVNEDAQVGFECPELTFTEIKAAQQQQLNNGKVRKVYANVKDWGEVYRLDCPQCGDTRGRLYICHAWGHQVRRKRHGVSFVVQFGKQLFCCHNEHCNIWPFLKNLKINKKEKEPLERHSVNKLKPNEHKGAVVVQQVPFPEGSKLITGDKIPAEVPEYLTGRGFDVHELAREYHVRYAPEGSVYFRDEKTGDTKSFWDRRIVIPIINRSRILSWQARSLDPEATKCKYLNPPRTNKSEYLYNMDRAWVHTEVVLVEGVTDVWKVGENAISIFGKVLHKRQLNIMEILWGHCGKLLIVLDREARAEARKVQKAVEQSDAFPDGVYCYTLPDDRDPGDYPADQIRRILAQEFADIADRERAVLPMNLDVNSNFFD